MLWRMETSIFQTEYVAGAMVTLLLSAMTYFMKQLHADFRKVVKELAELKSGTALMHAETQSSSKLLSQRLDFIEWRLGILEAPIKTQTKSKLQNHEKAS